jgi:type 1 glutamine amidotransferase
MRVSYLLAIVMALSLTSLKASATNTNTAFRVLVFSKTLGYRHNSITNGIAAIRDLGVKHNFSVEATEDSMAFSAVNLARFQAIVLLSVTGDVWNSEQQEAFKQYVLAGGGVAAIHGSIFGPLACEDKWAWYGELFCCAFTNHSQIQPATVDIEDSVNPSTKDLPPRWQRTDEWYNFTGTPRGCAHILATVDEFTYHGGIMGKDHPIAWCRPVGKGRMWFTAMGHTESSYSEPLFIQHIYGGIQYAIKPQTGDAAAAKP